MISRVETSSTRGEVFARIMATVVKAKDRESADSIIRRFKKKVFESELLTELKRREYYKKPSIERKERKKELERQRRYRRRGS